MTVLRVIANIAVPDPQLARPFYEELLGLHVAMDHGWIRTLSTHATMEPQLSFASQGGSGAEVPDLSIEVDNLEDVYRRAEEAGYSIVYSLTDEPWGVRRFFVHDPFGKIVNILAHTKPS
ncbi:VOC family protein [Rhizobium sp. S163]|uniref:VOC family protein n=1 Tax=Rhizobium sp. S163 TaxID=3055039 RepID=UPI0025A9E229|nr:VOC family protein [Rhizobium sp. S163]MDM9649141.1 VOC family protein [Rhizobium sp. S163]